MSSDRIQQYIGPKDPLEPSKRETSLDPDKFKKVLKVEETEEYQKRQKRRLKREEEVEEESENPTTDTPAEPTINFSEYLKEEKEGINPFAEQAKAPMRRMERQGINLVEESQMKAGLAQPSIEGAPSVSEEEEERFMAGLPTTSTNQASPSYSETPEFIQTSSPQETKKEEGKEKPKSPLAVMPPGKSLKKKSGIKKTNATEKIEGKRKAEKTLPAKIPASPREDLKERTEKGGEIPLEKKPPVPVSFEEKEKFFEIFSPKGTDVKIPEEKKILKELEKEPAEAPAQPLLRSQEIQSEFGEEKEKDKKKKEEPLLQPEIPTPTALPLEIPPLPTKESVPAYANLSPQMFEFFEKMVGLITVEQTKDVSRTTVTLKMQGSVFNGAQIILDHYSTTPTNAFNLTLAGSPEALKYFNENVDDLIAALKQSKFAFEVNIQKPILLQEFQALEKKKLKRITRSKKPK